MWTGDSSIAFCDSYFVFREEQQQPRWWTRFGCWVPKQSAAFRNFPAGEVAVPFGATGCTESSLRGLPRGRLGGEASFEGPASLSSVVGCRFACLVLGGSGFSLADSLGMVVAPVLSSTVCSWPLQRPAVLLGVTASRQAGPRREIRRNGPRNEQPAQLRS
ncbi:hypothetical protein HPB50_027839 [Hyalomma asiaticum]|nr:hypothetical protein HPB50_027839 [Hyalomma asiaticum]